MFVDYFKGTEGVLRSMSHHGTEVEDLLIENSYKKLKEQLTSRIPDSERQKIRQLLTAEEVGDRKPTK